MNHLLTKISEAVEQENWALVNQYLQQLLSIESQQQGTLAASERQLFWQIALLVLIKGDFGERWEVAKILPKLGTTSHREGNLSEIAPLIEILEDEAIEPEARWFAGRILGEFDQPEVIFSLVNILETTEDLDLAAIVAQSLANLGKSTINALTKLLEQPDCTLFAARALAQIRRPEVIEPLLTVVQNPDLAIRAIAIEALGSFHQPKIIPILITALEDLEASVRKEAAIALGFRADLAEKWDLLTHLQPLLYDFNLEVCQQAAIAISKLETEEAELALFKVLKSPHTPIPLQLTLIQALARKESSSSLQYLRQALSYVSPEGVLEIIRTIGRVETVSLRAEAAKILLEFYNNSGHSSLEKIQIKQELAHTWGQLKDKDTAGVLKQLAQDPNRGVQLHAGAALRYLQ
jgi:HEAT repeat protein